jgi:hypothetical protein
MKFKFLIMAAFLLAASCTSQEERAKERANAFLDAYLSTDYEKATELCVPELAGEIEEALRGMDSLDEGIREMIVKQAESISTEIVAVEKTGSRDSLFIKYMVTLPEAPSGIENEMTMVRREDAWFVAGFGK